MNELIPSAIAGGIESGRKASNLAFALIALPRKRRRDALVFYRFCRILDDIADSPALAAEEKARALDAWMEALTGGRHLPADLSEVISRHGIDRALLLEILSGVRSDLTVHRYATFEEVRRYCWRVASAVGLASIRIFGCADPASARYAESLGLALQWTNILRDVGEDAANGRIYLPLDELARFGVSESDILAGRSTDSFLRLMEFQADRAGQFFDEARAPRGDRRALRPAEIMRAIYAALLHRMQRDGFRVFARRYRISRPGKLLISARTILNC
ncbi:MAG: squalene/phytoene synthase family protein [Terrimicrobiaceae bacterium]|nr:squalene/phytoene synthase family protein [Terrimicrobiaceae bacterium]